MATAAIEVFKAGRHVAMSGEAIEFPPAALAAIAQAYDPENHEAPVVVGHPAHDHPAYGWVRGLKVEGDRLVAELGDVDPEFADLVKARRFAKVSASLYRPDSAANPTPGRWHLRHVAFLGAQPPSVKGLRPAQFASAAEALEFACFVGGAGGCGAPCATGSDFSNDLSTIEALARDAEDYREAMGELGIVVTAKAAIDHIRSGGAIPAPPAGGAAHSACYAEELAREAQMIQAAATRPMGLPEAVSRAETAISARLASGRAEAVDGSDPVDVARRARAHQARLAEMGITIGAADAVKAVIDGSAVA